MVSRQLSTLEAGDERSEPDHLLGLRSVRAFYGRGEEVLHGVDLELGVGEVVGLLGANGAGKTTTLRAISGLVRITGTVAFCGAAMTSAPQARARLGVAHVPEGRQVFGSLTVAENLLLGRQLLARHDRDPAMLDRVLAVFPELTALMKRSGGWLSGGEQQMVAIGRAMMAQPKLMLLDEPTMGLAPVVVERLHAVFAPENRGTLAVLVAEENSGFVAAVTDRTYVLRRGRVAWSGPSHAVVSDPGVREMLLG